MKGHLRHLGWGAHLPLVGHTYRLGRLLLAVHAPGDPLCRRARSRAVAHTRGHGLECAPCAGQRRVDALWDQLLEGRG